jgi:hypothetical protein
MSVSIVQSLSESSEATPPEPHHQTTSKISASQRLDPRRQHISQGAEPTEINLETTLPITSSVSWTKPSINVKSALPRLQSLQSEGG